MKANRVGCLLLLLFASPALAQSTADEVVAGFANALEPTRRALTAAQCDLRQRTCVAPLLEAMTAHDQAMRTKIGPLRPVCEQLPDGQTATCRFRLMGYMTAIDEANTAVVEQIIAVHGWPSRAAFDETAEKNAWLLVQHADRKPEFQKQVLSLLEASVARGDSTPRRAALLRDRIATADKNPQRYGTQGRCLDSGVWEEWQVEEPAKLDERRASVGLGPIAEYRTRIQCPVIKPAN